MAAPITHTATTLEGQLVETLQALEGLEKTYNAANPAATKNQVSISVDPEVGSISGSFTLGCVVSGAGGNLSFATTAYL
jgi:hypothetical protein